MFNVFLVANLANFFFRRDSVQMNFWGVRGEWMDGVFRKVERVLEFERDTCFIGLWQVSRAKQSSNLCLWEYVFEKQR